MKVCNGSAGSVHTENSINKLLNTVLIVIAAGGFFIVSVVIWKRDILLVSRNYVMFYALLPACLSLTCLIGLRLTSTGKLQLLVYLGAAAVSLYWAQIYLSLSPAVNKFQARLQISRQAALAEGRRFDSRSLTEVMDALRASGTPAVPLFTPTHFLRSEGSKGGIMIGNRVVFPLAGPARSTTVYCNEGGDWLIFDSDRFGFNNPDGVWESRNFNVAVLGDSFAVGACVPFARGAVDIIRRTYPATLNFGVGGTGPLIQLGILKEYVASIRPQVVLWFFYEANDLNLNLTDEKESSLLMRYLANGFSQGLREIREETDQRILEIIGATLPTTRQAELEPTKRTVGFRGALTLLTLRDRLGLTSCPSRKQDFSLFKEIIATAKQTVEAWGGTLYFVYLPSWFNCDIFDVRAERWNWLKKRVLTDVAGLNVRIIDAHEMLGRQADPTKAYYYRGSHLNEWGYQFLADVVLDRLGKDSVLATTSRK